MNIGSVVWNEKIRSENIYSFIETILSQAEKSEQTFVVFPAYILDAFCSNDRLIDFFIESSVKFPNLVICPGSHFKKVASKKYHISYLIQNGDVILQQKQLYLAKWEGKLGLSRTSKLNFININGLKVALVISTDTFYPQVIRFAKLQGAHLIISPVGMIGPRNFARQLSGLWQNVQQNTLFAIESGLKSKCYDQTFFSESIIHAPIELTKASDGMLLRESRLSDLLNARIDLKSLENGISFKPLEGLNKKAYKNLFSRGVSS